MVVSVLLVAVLVLGLVQAATVRRLARLEAAVRELSAAGGLRPPAPEAPLAPPSPAPPAGPRAPAPPRPPLRLRPEPVNLEALVAGKLPIWIGGAALVLAGFFLVRYSIETGLLGPAVRSTLAALFSAALVAAGEGARRWPATREDPRIAQVLAGAGIASAYGTLYLAAAAYGLIGPAAGFVLMLAITLVALALALRHGPPTAVMALVGGFVAPLVAGFDAAGLAPLLLYLGLFIAALFGLAIHRGWAWLALAAAASGFAWANFLLFALAGREVAGVGAFVVLVAIGATAALPATGAASRWLRLAPLVAGLVQILVVAPALDFGAFAWALYLVLAGAALVLAWREPAMLPGALAALALTLALIAIALVQPDRGATPAAIVIATFLFAAPGQLLSRRAPEWAWLAVGGTAGPVLVANLVAPSLLHPAGWAAAELALALFAAALSWRHAGRPGDAGLVGGALAAATLLLMGLGQLAGTPGVPLLAALAALGLFAWAGRTGDPALFAAPLLPWTVAIVTAAGPLWTLLMMAAQSLAGEPLTYPLLPPPGEALRALAPPALAAAVLLRDDRAFGAARRAVAAAAVVLALAALLVLAKQPLAIADADAFQRFGFLERALITQALLAAGWAAFRWRRHRRLGTALMAVGLFRIGWFDLLVLSPVTVPQAVGPLPVLNLATLHLGLAALWFWRLPPTLRARRVALALSLLAALATVRQATHGTLLTGPVGDVENWGYSLLLQLLALGWFLRGVAAHRRDLRAAGLALLVAATLKAFLIDTAALDGGLRVLSFLGLAAALIAIGWAYRRYPGEPASQA